MAKKEKIIYVKPLLKNKYYCIRVEWDSNKVLDCEKISKAAYYKQSKKLQYLYPTNISFTKNFPYFGNVYAYFAER